MDMDQGLPGLSWSNLEAEIDEIKEVPTGETDEPEINEINDVRTEEIDEVNVVLTEEMMFNNKCRGNRNFFKKIDSTSITGFPF